MSNKDQRHPAPLTKEERLAKALRDNLARRKALVRAKRARTTDTATPDAKERDDDAPS